MSSLGDLLLSHHKPKDSDSSNGATTPSQDPKVFPDRVEKNTFDTQSNASSTDDYVNELLDPNDRQRNVWHVVEGPKVEEKNEQDEGESHNEISNKHEDETRERSSNRHRDDDEGHEGHKRERSQGRERDRDLDSDKDRDRDVDKDRHSERDRDRDRDRNRDRDRGGDRDRHRERERDIGSDREREKDRERDDDRRSSSSRHRSSRRRHDYSDDDDDRDRRRSRRDHRSKASSSSRRRERSRSDSLSPVTKRNSRTILIMQLNPKVNSRDLEELFSEIGKVKEVRLIMDSKTRRHKGIAYIEFEDAESAQKAFSLNGQRFFDAPIVIQSAQLDRNYRSSGDRHSSSTSHPVYASSSRSNLPPNCYRVYVGGLNVNLTEDMIRSIFEPFGPIVRLELMRDRSTNVSRGYAFITYARIEDGQEAVQCLNGFELAGKALRVSKSTEKNERHSNQDSGHHDSDSESRSSRVKDVTASLFELAGH